MRAPDRGPRRPPSATPASPAGARTLSPPPATRALGTLAFATLVFVALLMGGNHVAARLAFDHGADVATAVAARSLGTAAVTGLLLAGGRVAMTASARERRALLGIGLLVGLQSLWLYASVARLPVALALLVFNTYPLTTALWARALYRQRLERRLVVTMGILLLGLALALDVLGATSGLGLAARWRQIGAGVGAAFAASTIFGLALVLTQHEAGRLDGRLRTFVIMGLTSLVALGSVAWQGGFHWPQAAAGWWGLALLTALYGTGITILLTLLPRWGVVGNTAIMNVEPVFALVLAWAILDQRIAPVQVAGALIVVGAVIAVGMRRAPAGT